MTAPRRPVIVHVDELVLHGVRPGDRNRVAEAMSSELARLLSDRGAPALLESPSSVDMLRAGAVRLQGGGSPRTLGHGIARSLYNAMKDARR